MENQPSSIGKTFAQNIDHLKRIVMRDRMKFEFHGCPAGMIDHFIRQVEILKSTPEDEHYKRKLLKKSSKKEVLKSTLATQYKSLYTDLNLNRSKKPKIDPMHMSDKQLLRECCLVIDIINQLPTETELVKCRMSFEKQISEFEELVFEYEQATILRIEKSIERNKITKDLLLHIKELSQHGQLIWNSINYYNFEDYKFFQEIASMPSTLIY